MKNIEWDSDLSSIKNQGTDGMGLIVDYDVHRCGGQAIVRLNCKLYSQEDMVRGSDLSNLSEKIAELIHKHLG